MDSAFNIKISDDPVKVMEDIKTLKEWIAKTEKEMAELNKRFQVKQSVLDAYNMVLEDYLNGMRNFVK